MSSFRAEPRESGAIRSREWFTSLSLRQTGRTLAHFAATMQPLLTAFGLAGLSGAIMLLFGMMAGWAYRRISGRSQAPAPAGPLRLAVRAWTDPRDAREPASRRRIAPRHDKIRQPVRAGHSRIQAGQRSMKKGLAPLAA